MRTTKHQICGGNMVQNCLNWKRGRNNVVIVVVAASAVAVTASFK